MAKVRGAGDIARSSERKTALNQELARTQAQHARLDKEIARLKAQQAKLPQILAEEQTRLGALDTAIRAASGDRILRPRRPWPQPECEALMRSHTRSDVKWLVNQVAALAGKLARLDEEVTRLAERRASLEKPIRHAFGH